MPCSLRPATPEDAPALSRIYREYVLTTTVTFETEPPDAEEFARRITHTLTEYPYLVWEQEGRVTGYAYAHRYGERAAYGWSAEASIYLSPAAQGTGAARRLYGALIALLQAMGCVHLYGKVAYPNPRSEAFHRSMGFSQVAFLPHIGFKLGRWVGLTYYHYPLLSTDSAPAPVTPFPRLDPGLVRSLLEKYGK